VFLFFHPKAEDSSPITDSPGNQGTKTGDSASISSIYLNQGTKAQDSSPITASPGNQGTKTGDNTSKKNFANIK